MNSEKYSAAMYLRLSKDDEDCGSASKIESNSISNQRELIRSFIQSKPDIELYDVYIDDGFSGSDFLRPDFQRMTKDIEDGRVNCVIVKDLSRFGRDYIDTGRYLQRIYPSMQVRFIAVNDHYDSLSANVGEQSIVVPVKNFINDAYCRDISIKTKTGREAKCHRGECVSPFAAYGYKKDEKDKNHLVVDPYAGKVVKTIFWWKILGYSSAAIANKLNDAGILSPAEYKKTLGLNYTCPFSGTQPGKWSSKAIHRILTDRVYLGHMEQCKTERISYKVKTAVAKPKSEWICVENTHEALITEEDFEIVENLLLSDCRIGFSSGELDLFSGLLFCGDCKERMVRRIRKSKEEHLLYICSTANRREGCTSHSIESDKLKELVEQTVFHYMETFLDNQAALEKIRKLKVDFSELEIFDTEIERLEAERLRYTRLRNSLTDDLYKEVISKTEYNAFAATFDQRIEDFDRALSKQRDILKRMYRRGAASVERLHEMQRVLWKRELDRYSLCSFVRRIYVYENRIDIEFFFQDQYRVMEEMKKRSTIVSSVSEV